MFGASHHTTPLEIREKLALAPDKRIALGHALTADPGVAEFCLLGTCNRVEIYCVATDSATPSRIASSFCTLQAIDPATLAACSTQRAGLAALDHLFAVASGLDSQMVGETEILGQVKEAYSAAQAAGQVGPLLNRVFQKAFQSAKLIRSETAIGEGQVSVATVAVSLAEKIFGRLRDSRVLVIGAGDIAEKTAKALRSREAGTVVFVNRTAERAEDLASEYGGSHQPFDQLTSALAHADIVVTSTASQEPVITSAMAAAAMHKRASRPLFLIDLALPRDIEASAGDLPNVYLYNLDDLARLAEENIALRQAEISRARAIIHQRAAALWHKLAGDASLSGSGEVSGSEGIQPAPDGIR
jgi:glutamyl-tRNA reductase